MRTLLEDIRYALRIMFKRPTVTVLALIALALGIGATTAIFSVINSVLLKPLPYPQPDQLVRVWEKRPALGRIRNVVSVPDFLDWRAQNTTFESMAAFFRTEATVDGGDSLERIDIAAVTADMFSILRVQPRLGRSFQADEDQAGKERVVILSDGFWKRRMAADPGVVDRQITLNGNSFSVVGVMSPNFAFPTREVDAWVPLVFSEGSKTNRGGHSFEVIARLRSDATINQARQNMDEIAASLESQYQVNTGHGVNVFSLYEEEVGDVKTALWVLFGAVVFVLLIACANVANLLLVRAASRRREIAVRAALGAGRLRIVRQLLTESLMLSITGGAIGVLLAMWGLDLLLSISPASIPRGNEVKMDLLVLCFTLAVSIGTGVIFGLAPALQASKPDLSEALKEGGRGSGLGTRGNRVRSALVIAEVAVCLVLLVGAGLMIRSFTRLTSVYPGFNPDNVLTVKISPGRKYDTTQKVTSYFQQTLERLSAMPGVESAGAALSLPLSGGAGSRYFSIEGRPPQPPGQGYNANLNMTAPGYFKTMGIPLIRGRDFSDADSGGAPEVVIINDQMSRMFWPDEDPIGQRIQVGDRPWRTVIGIVGDIKYKAMDADTRQEMYWPYYQDSIGVGAIVVRTKTEPAAMASLIRSTMLDVERDQPLYDIKTMQDILADSLAGRSFNTMLLGAFATTALILVVVGLYGVMSYSVTQRTNEIGIRMALGATSGDVLRLIVRNGMLLAVTGIGTGIGAAIGLTRLIKSLLFDVKPTDPVTLIVIALILATVSFLASVIPARRATRVDPLAALRWE